MNLLPRINPERERPNSLEQAQTPSVNVELSHPTYAGTFSCIGPQCEDTCCGDWDIPVDKITYQQYRQFPAEKLGSLVSHFVSVREGRPHDNFYALIQRTPTGSCPFFGEDRLCAIQEHHGASLLSATCSTYPRSLAEVGGTLEGALSLSCPEAARLVLLEEHSVKRTSNLLSGEFRTDSIFGVQKHSGLESMFLLVRGLIIDLIRDRSRPLWHRLLLIVSFCGRLDSIAQENRNAVTGCLTLYRNSIGEGDPSEFNHLSPGIKTRLQVTIELSNQRCRDKDCGRRFRDVFWDFIEGIGSADSQGADEDVHRFRSASVDYLQPMLSESPFMIENYLLNYVYQHLFPFGRTGSTRFVAHTMAEEAVLMVVQYSWLTTLLTGVAARHGPAFSKAHLVATVQSFTRAVEHAPHILEDALAFVSSCELDTISGLAKLLRT